MASPIKWIGALLALALLCPATAGAQTSKWDKNRPRRAQVSKRPANQNSHNDHGVKSGAVIARQQQKPENPQENPVGKPIHQDKRPAAP